MKEEDGLMVGLFDGFWQSVDGGRLTAEMQ